MPDSQLHWPEYLAEALLLGAFLFAACLFTALLEHPAALAHTALPDPLVRRAVMGLAMGVTAVALIRSPLGQRSGAHLNPAVTLTYWTLGRVRPLDALGYVAAQFTGALLGVAVANAVIGPSILADRSVHYAATRPGLLGPTVAAGAEAVISFTLMTTVLHFANTRRLERYTPFAAGTLVALFITFEAPLSGMSMNPARTTGSALLAGEPLWPRVYFLAPVAGMLAAAALYRGRVYCAKLHHANHARCIFLCHYGALHSHE